MICVVGAVFSLAQSYILNIAGSSLVTSVRQKLFKVRAQHISHIIGIAGGLYSIDV